MSEKIDERQRRAPVADTTRELYLYSGNLCAFPDCSQPLLKDDGTWNCEIAHIYGVKRSAARGEHDLTNEELRAPWNLLLLCLNHHNQIDNKNLEDKFSVQVVRDMKARHESRYREALSGLERLLDTAAGLEPQYPSNLRAINYPDDETLRDSLALVIQFIDSVAEQPAAFRDIITMILKRGKQNRGLSSSFRSPVSAPARSVTGWGSLSEAEVSSRARHLEMAGLLDIIDDDDIEFYILTSLMERELGWDIFVDLQDLAVNDKSIIDRAIIDLDFTVFEN